MATAEERGEYDMSSNLSHFAEYRYVNSQANSTPHPAGGSKLGLDWKPGDTVAFCGTVTKNLETFGAHGVKFYLRGIRAGG